MQALSSNTDLVRQLQKQILSLQGFKKGNDSDRLAIGLPQLEDAFPNDTFPIGAVHELISKEPEEAAATNGFIAGLLSRLMQRGGACLWVGTKRTIFPPALKAFGNAPERVVFIDLAKPKDVLWTIEEALKCDVLCAVIGDLAELSFADSRRLQLAVEKSRVTGFIHRHNPKTENTVACVTRWKVRPLPSSMEDGMPGVGFPRWNVQLLKVRNGRPGAWDIEWRDGSFRHMAKPMLSRPVLQTRKAG